MTELSVTCWNVTESNLQLIQQLSCQEFYSVLEWCNINTAQDMYYWSQIDSEFKLEEKYNTKSIRNILHTPLWASGVDRKNCKFKPTAYPPRVLDTYAKFCVELVKRYPGREWVLFGEVDNDWPREDPKVIQWASDMQTYVEMAKLAYIEMKRQDTTCKVSMSSLVSATLNGVFPTVVEDGKPLSKLHNFDKLLELGMGDFTDTICIDLYCYGYGNVRNFLAGVRKIKEVMAKYNVRKPIYITEIGAKITPSDGKIAKTFHHEVVTEETQAGFLMKIYKWGKEANIKKMFWHTLKSSEWGLFNRFDREHLSCQIFKAIKSGLLQ